jgi:peptidoglycan-N-acetylglucosamine deacetylase
MTIAGRVNTSSTAEPRKPLLENPQFRMKPMLEIAMGIAGAAAVVFAGYSAMAPTSQLYGPTLVRASNLRQLALTFDDGPNDPHTLRLLEVLEKHDARATFFMIGRYVQQRPQIARAVAEAGHALGNHTFTHPNLIFCSKMQTRIQLAECNRAIEDAAGLTPKLFRPPFGGRRPSTLRIARELGLAPVMWNVTGFDWDAHSSEAVERKVAKKVHGGDIILLHDGSHRGLGFDRSHTVAATDRLLGKYKAEGFQFVTVSEVLA